MCNLTDFFIGVHTLSFCNYQNLPVTVLKFALTKELIAELPVEHLHQYANYFMMRSYIHTYVSYEETYPVPWISMSGGRIELDLDSVLQGYGFLTKLPSGAL